MTFWHIGNAANIRVPLTFWEAQSFCVLLMLLAWRQSVCFAAVANKLALKPPNAKQRQFFLHICFRRRKALSRARAQNTTVRNIDSYTNARVWQMGKSPSQIVIGAKANGYEPLADLEL